MVNRVQIVGFAGIVSMLGLGVGSCQRFTANRSLQNALQAPVPLPQDEHIQVYFNQNQAASYTDPYRDFTRPGDDLEAVLLNAIAKAETTIEVAIQQLELPRIAQALADKHQAGVQIRVVLENNYTASWTKLTASELDELSERDRTKYDAYIALVDLDQNGQLSETEIEQRDAISILDKARVPWLDDTADGSKGSGLMHHKFLIADGKTVITGSANFTLSGIHGDLLAPETRGNANHLLEINDFVIAQFFQAEFEKLWGDGPGEETDSQFGRKKPKLTPQQFTVGNNIVTIHFAPSAKNAPWNSTSGGLISQTLESTAQSAELALFVFSDQALVNTLNQLNLQGIEIRALIDHGFAYRYYSEALDMWGVALTRDCEYEDKNQPWSAPIDSVGIPEIPTGDKLHHKFAVLDNQTVITGSYNWSPAANFTNDETLIVIQNSVIAAHFTREFERLYDGALLGVPLWLEDKIAADKTKCGL
ncbi:MAG: phospholipase D-like domain-containing protein [Cyanobacteria bacterium P01_H01_bin.15]